MHTSRFQSITARFSPHNLRTSFRRSLSSSSSVASSRASSTDRASFGSHASSPVSSTINSIVLRQKSMLEMQLDEEERPPHILEPRPAATFCSLEERMLSF